MKRLFVVLAALGFTALLPLVYFRFTPLAIDGVTVTPRPSCDNATDTKTRSSFEWKDGMLLVDISEAKTCGLRRQSVAVQRIGGRLFVRTTYPSHDGPLAACYCRHNFSLLVPDVPEQDYGIIVYNAP